jgi:hypothetical protein
MFRSSDDSDLSGLIHRYVTPGRRYLKLGGSLFRMADGERAEFLRKLSRAAQEITPRELTVLLDAGWRERKAAAWLVAVAGRTEFRERLGGLLLASEAPYAGQAYCVALGTFGTSADAEILAGYLDRYLLRPNLPYDQARVLGTLLHVDAKLGTEQAARFLTPGGLWQQWAGDHADPEKPRRHIAQLCAFVEEAAGHGSARRG